MSEEEMRSKTSVGGGGRGEGSGGRNGSQDSTELVQVESHLLPLNLAQERGGRDTGVTSQASRSLSLKDATITTLL